MQQLIHLYQINFLIKALNRKYELNEKLTKKEAKGTTKMLLFLYLEYIMTH